MLNPTTEQSALRVAVLGGGAVTRVFYLPLFQSGVAGLRLIAIVDPSKAALQKLTDLPDEAVAIDAPYQKYFSDLAPGSIDAVVVALPHHMHEECVVAALKLGLHVFCEKPLGLSSESVRRMLEAATDASRQLAACQPRRSFSAAIAIRDLLQTGWMGAVRSVSWNEGQPYAWPAESLSQIFEEHGGGELFDIGAHAFDLLAWWLGDLKVVAYSDDSAGGTAAEYDIALKSATGVSAQIRLSRLHPLANAIEIETERGDIRWDLKDQNSFSIAIAVGYRRHEVTIDAKPGVKPSMLDAVRAQLLEFVKSVQQLPNDSVGCKDALNYARIFDECREQQQRSPRIAFNSSGVRAVVTGAGGFIGTRLVEMLDDQGTPVLGLARRAQSCVRLARRAVQMRICDICDRADLDQSLSCGGDVIFHCAVASGSTDVVWQTIVEGTMNVLHAAERHGLRRVVVFSSMMALGNPNANGVIDDDSPPNESELVYAKAKLEMERRCREFAANSRVEVVILRPTCVFGPFGRDFGSAHLDRQAKGEFFLTDSGRGLANLVYVDNLVEAAILASKAECPSGSTMIINEEEWPMTWADFFAPQMKRAFGDDTVILDLPTSALVELGTEHRRNHAFPAVFRQAIRSHAPSAEWVSRNQLFRGWKAARNWRRRRVAASEQLAQSSRRGTVDQAAKLRMLLECSLKQSRSFPCGPFFLSFYTTQAIFRSDRARSYLGWRPRIDRQTAMNETLGWVERAYPDWGQSERENCY
ncbi:NAD-dependent epimerase/dehydratase family protein [Pseudomonadota bacterium]